MRCCKRSKYFLNPKCNHSSIYKSTLTFYWTRCDTCTIGKFQFQSLQFYDSIPTQHSVCSESWVINWGDNMNDVSAYLWLEACCCRCQEASSSRTLPGVRGRGALPWAGQCAGSRALATPALKTRPRNLINRNLIKKQTGKRLGSFLLIFSCTSLHLILNIKLVFWDISRNVLSSFAGSFRFD